MLSQLITNLENFILNLVDLKQHILSLAVTTSLCNNNRTNENARDQLSTDINKECCHKYN